MRQLKFRMNFKIRKLQKQYVSSVIAQVVIIKCNVHNCKYSSHFTCRLQHQQTAGKSRESYQPLATDCLPNATKDFFEMQIAMGRVAKDTRPARRIWQSSCSTTAQGATLNSREYLSCPVKQL